MAPKPDNLHEAELEAELTSKLATVLSGNPGISPKDAMRAVTADMLANNPFVPPKHGCPINDLPNELLAHIFLVGVEMEAEEEDEEDVEADNESIGEEWETTSEEASDGEDGGKGDWEKRRQKQKQKLKEAERDGVEVVDVNEYRMDVDGGGLDEKRDSLTGKVLPFQVLVSHVCRHWREIAVESPALWTTFNFSGDRRFELAKSKVWIARSKGLPLDIYIDCTIDDEHELPEEEEEGQEGTSDQNRDQEDTDPDSLTGKPCPDCGDVHPAPLSRADLAKILDVLIPHVDQWRLFELTVSTYEYIYLTLSRFESCPGAPSLEVLQMYHIEECEEFDQFEPVELSKPFFIFNGIVPKLSVLALSGVHLDWDRSLSFIAGLHELELAFHAKDVRPSFATFSEILRNSPNLHTLTLSLSGPADHDEATNDWGREPLEAPSLVELVFSYHELSYALQLLRHLSTPNVRSLVLDFEGSDYTALAEALTRPMPGKTQSLLSGLEHLKIAGLPCSEAAADAMYEQMAGLKTLNLNSLTHEGGLFFESLTRSLFSEASNGTKVFCPSLHTLTSQGIDMKRIKRFVEARKAAGLPIKKVCLAESDETYDSDEEWLEENCILEYFEPSDSDFIISEAEDDEDEADLFLEFHDMD